MAKRDTLAARVRKAREALGWSQRELDRRCKLSLGFTRKLETGTRPRVDNLIRIAKALGIALELLA